jgi:3-oxoacyl-[acyl-carrier-protein] synthase II
VRRHPILGIGQVSACGPGAEAVRTALAGHNPEPTWLPAPGIGPEASVPVFLASPKGLEELVNPRAIRRMDPFSQRFLLAALLARTDSGISLDDPERVGVVVATGYGPLRSSFGFLDGVIDEGDDLGSPFLFAGSVHNAPASTISASMGLQGPTLTLTAFAHGWPRALQIGSGWLDGGLVDHVLVGAGDEYHELVGSQLEAVGGWPADGRVRPLEFSRCTYVPGETFVAILLGREGIAHARWGLLEEPAFPHTGSGVDELLADGPVFLAAKGEKAAGEAYREIARGDRPVVAPTPLWGANPTCDAMTTVAAAIALAEGKVQPGGKPEARPGDSPGTLVGAPGEARLVRCVSCDLPGESAIVTVHAAERGS